jgi:hypothetical protein
VPGFGVGNFSYYVSPNNLDFVSSQSHIFFNLPDYNASFGFNLTAEINQAQGWCMEATTNSSHITLQAILLNSAVLNGYQVLIDFITSSSSGILDLHINGVSVGTTDLYTTGTVYNAGHQFSVAASAFTTGSNTIEIWVNGKNASSSNYHVAYSSITLIAY